MAPVSSDTGTFFPQHAFWFYGKSKYTVRVVHIAKSRKRQAAARRQLWIHPI